MGRVVIPAEVLNRRREKREMNFTWDEATGELSVKFRNIVSRSIRFRVNETDYTVLVSATGECVLAFTASKPLLFYRVRLHPDDVGTIVKPQAMGIWF